MADTVNAIQEEYLDINPGETLLPETDTFVLCSCVHSHMTENIEQLIGYTNSEIIVSVLSEDQIGMEMDVEKIAIEIKSNESVSTLLKSLQKARRLIPKSPSTLKLLNSRFEVDLNTSGQYTYEGSQEKFSNSSPPVQKVQDWLREPHDFNETLKHVRQCWLKNTGHPGFLFSFTKGQTTLRDKYASMSFSQRVGVWIDVVFSLDYLHSFGLACRSLWLDRIIIDEDMHARIDCSDLVDLKLPGSTDLRELIMIHRHFLFIDVDAKDETLAMMLLPSNYQLDDQIEDFCLSKDFVEAAINACCQRVDLIMLYWERLKNYISFSDNLREHLDIQMSLSSLNSCIRQKRIPDTAEWNICLGIARCEPIQAILALEQIEGIIQGRTARNMFNKVRGFLENVLITAIQEKKKVIQGTDIPRVIQFLERNMTGPTIWAIGKLYLRNKDAVKAKDIWLSAEKKGLSHPLVLIELGKLARRSGNLEEAIHLFQKVSQSNDWGPWYQAVCSYQIGKTQIKSGDRSLRRDAFFNLRDGCNRGHRKGIRIIFGEILRNGQISDNCLTEMIDYLEGAVRWNHFPSYEYLIEFLKRRNKGNDVEKAKELEERQKAARNFGKMLQETKSLMIDCPASSGIVGMLK